MSQLRCYIYIFAYNFINLFYFITTFAKKKIAVLSGYNVMPNSDVKKATQLYPFNKTTFILQYLKQ